MASVMKMLSPTFWFVAIIFLVAESKQELDKSPLSTINTYNTGEKPLNTTTEKNNSIATLIDNYEDTKEKMNNLPVTEQGLSPPLVDGAAALENNKTTTEMNNNKTKEKNNNNTTTKEKNNNITAKEKNINTTTKEKNNNKTEEVNNTTTTTTKGKNNKITTKEKNNNIIAKDKKNNNTTAKEKNNNTTEKNNNTTNEKTNSTIMNDDIYEDMSSFTVPGQGLSPLLVGATLAGVMALALGTYLGFRHKYPGLASGYRPI